ncbi:AAA and adenylate/guanylate cyclase domain-containing protein [Treponema brennaborense]|uniref:Tetratricopeptide TPR_1 repeat-containing protein n=1 Tax=Treponema brennaborense (strain DSM 12168 / CIP 105900 / DD5/3) TaxID=906968 RepID=F4LN15_TREBD|nr:AAA and adenylate/guanylate cyclase domain-containing protein [Treponema brennaborense]AEE15801.1 Tetratricopeptide TPR_1 repeat-containing protein [Treponema brennaborense DSM 12168]
MCKNDCVRCKTLTGFIPSRREVASIITYLPHRIVNQLDECPCCVFERNKEQLRGTVVYIDLVGFTPIVLNYIKDARGPIENLSEIFFEYFNRLIEPIQKLGGSVYQIAGDSLLIGFELLAGETEYTNWNRAWTAVQICCANSAAYNAECKERNGFELVPKTGVGFGDFYQLIVGKRGNLHTLDAAADSDTVSLGSDAEPLDSAHPYAGEQYFTAIICGRAVDDAVNSEKSCKPARIVLAASAMSAMRKYVAAPPACTPIGDSFYELSPAGDWHGDYDPVQCELELNRKIDELSNERFFGRALSFTAPQLHEQIIKNFKLFSGEYRDVSCVMVQVSGDFIDTVGDDRQFSAGFGNFSNLYDIIQEDALRFGGFLLKPDISDKGNVFPVLFGAPNAIENAEKKAVLFSDALYKKSIQLPFVDALSIGIASGKVYCGEIGSKMRKDFSVVGVTVNLASRFMTASGKNCIFTDEATKNAIPDLCEFSEKMLIKAKGFTEPQPVYRILSVRHAGGSRKKSVLIGRREELEFLKSRQKLSEAGNRLITGIIGDAGMGKSLLVETLLEDIGRGRSVPEIICGSCYQYEQTTTFYPWREIVRTMFDIPEACRPEELEELLREKTEQLFSDEQKKWTVPFFIMMGCLVEEPDEIKDIDPSIKQMKIFSLVNHILSDRAQDHPVVIVIEDIHWIDHLSLKLVEYLGAAVADSPVHFILPSRQEDCFAHVKSCHNVSVLHLKKLEHDAAFELAQRLLNSESEEAVLIEKIIGAADCNPFFIENIVLNLVSEGSLQELDTGKRRLVKSIDQIVIPSSIQGIILSRLDSLKFDEQIIIKTASVMGRTFIPEILQAVIPPSIPENVFKTALYHCEANNFILCEQAETVNYIFKHVMIRDALYNTLLERTRHEINKLLLLYLEHAFKDNLIPICERLAYHSIESGDTERIITYSLMAASKAEKQYAIQESVHHYENALRSIENSGDALVLKKLGSVQLRLASVYRQSGEYRKAVALYNEAKKSAASKMELAEIWRGVGHCYQEQGSFSDAIGALETSLKLLGIHTPKRPVYIGLSLVREVLVQVCNWLFFKDSAIQAKNAQIDRIEKICQNFLVLDKLYYFDRAEKLAWSTIAGHNMAAKLAGRSDIRCISNADYGVTLLSIGMLKLSRHQFGIAEKASEAMSNATVSSIYKARYAFFYLFYNQPIRSMQLLEEAVAHFRNAGEMWELMTAEGALAQNYFLISDVRKSEKAYRESGDIATRLNSPMHIGWAYNKIPFIKYLCAELAAREAEQVLKKGIKLSASTNDHMTLCIHYGHLCYIAEKEKNVQKTVEYVRQIMRENEKYPVNIPHVKISYVNAAEGILFVLERIADGAVDASDLPCSVFKLEKLLRRALKQAERLGETFDLIKGGALRAQARYARYSGNTGKAARLALLASDFLKTTPFRWEYANALLETARCIPERAEACRSKARRIFTECGMHGEAQRMGE